MKINTNLIKILSIIQLLLIMTVGNLGITTNAFFGGECITKEGYTASDCGQDKCPGGVMNWQKNKCEEYDGKIYKEGCRIGCVKEETEIEKIEYLLRLSGCEDIMNLETSQCLKKCTKDNPNSKVCNDPYPTYCSKKIDSIRPYCNYNYDQSKPPLLVWSTFDPVSKKQNDNGGNGMKFVDNTKENRCGDNYKNCPNMGKNGVEYTKILELNENYKLQNNFDNTPIVTTSSRAHNNILIFTILIGIPLRFTFVVIFLFSTISILKIILGLFKKEKVTKWLIALLICVCVYIACLYVISLTYSTDFIGNSTFRFFSLNS
jgi:hypothetical protein